MTFRETYPSSTSSLISESFGRFRGEIFSPPRGTLPKSLIGGHPSNSRCVFWRSNESPSTQRSAVPSFHGGKNTSKESSPLRLAQSAAPPSRFSLPCFPSPQRTRRGSPEGSSTPSGGGRHKVPPRRHAFLCPAFLSRRERGGGVQRGVPPPLAVAGTECRPAVTLFFAQLSFHGKRKLVPGTGLEPVLLSKADFKSAASAVPPPGRGKEQCKK